MNANLSGSVVSSRQQFFTEGNASREIVSSGINFGFQTLVVVHKKLDTTYITRAKRKRAVNQCSNKRKLFQSI